jgi:acyl dehydratase
VTIVHVNDVPGMVGIEFGPTAPMRIDQHRVDLFADATDDHQWIHTDAERAASDVFGTTIAHGYLTLSLLSSLARQLITVEGCAMGINYGLNRCRFTSPVRVGNDIEASCTIASVDQLGPALQMVLDFDIRVVGSPKPACVAEVVYRYMLAPL